jgi:drug/metabolite transporter (DMT)-like permease
VTAIGGQMLGAGLALAGAVGYAASDVVSARAVRRVPPAGIVLWSHVVAVAALVPAAALAGGPGSAAGAATALLAGALAGVGMIVYYGALRIGPTSVASPVAASGVAIPVVVALALGGGPGVWALGGLAVLVGGIGLVAGGGGDRAGARVRATVVRSLVAAACFGVYFLALDSSTARDPGATVSVAALLAVGTVVPALALALLAGGARPPRAPGDLRLVAAIGALIAAGDVLVATATVHANVAVVSVVASLDPVAAVVLARLVLAERLSRRQRAGVALALAGVGAVAAA